MPAAELPNVPTILGLLVSGGTLTALANWIASKYKRDETRMNSDVQRAAQQQQAEEKFRDDLIGRLNQMQALMDAQAEKVNAQALEIAELRGEVRVLKHSENYLTLENTRLTAENAALKARAAALDDENEMQGQKIAELTGRLAVYETTPVATPTIAPTPPPGDCP